MRDDVPQRITPQLLLRAYASGVFPMAESAKSRELFWVDPDMRGILPLDGLHISRSLRKTILAGRFDVSVSRNFSRVLNACAQRDETWINTEIRGLYLDLHRLGYAHSIEIYDGDTLVGGLYGVVIGGAFFGESMFSRRRDASKIALAYLVARLRAGGFSLLDTQFVTEHLRSLGAQEITRSKYHERLDKALARPADFWRLSGKTDPQSILHLITQIS